MAENILNREFTAAAPNEKRHVYLSAVLDLYDRRIVSYVIHNHNNALVFYAVDEAVWLNPQSHPLFHSDRGFQYTNRAFYSKLATTGITQSMSIAAKWHRQWSGEMILGNYKAGTLL
ncbi:MAG: DDE-type integrase/transposase/recombinase [Lachnospiraceae bacterium]|nr:DDE-type integrase/transposase/recombinase [Lachnospiraceae bacterium]